MSKVELHLGDCLKIMPTLGHVDVVITDPPYGVSENSGRRLHAYKDPEKSKGRIGWSNMADVTDYGNTHWDNEPLSQEQWKVIRDMSKEQIVFGANHLLEVLGKAGSIVVWDKKLKNGWDDYFSDCELIWCSRIQPDKVYRQLWMGALRQGEKQERCHPTQKPIELMEWLIRRHTDEGMTVLDPFMGSGTTGVACVKTGRNFIGIEVNQTYYDVAQKRISDAQSQLPLF